MSSLARLLLILTLGLLIACSDDKTAASDKSSEQSNGAVTDNTSAQPSASSAETESDKNNVEAESGQEAAPLITKESTFKHLRKVITFGDASLAEVKQALTQEDIGELTNTMHALYSMRWHRGVYYILYDLWHLKKDKYPDFAWTAIESIPARIALASTINRIQIYDAEEFQDYIRAHMYDEHEFHRAQVVVALGLNGNPDDVDYIKEMAAGDNAYVAQSAISSLAMVGHEKARDAMIDLYNQHQDNARGDLLQSLLKKAYDWEPENKVEQG